MKTPTDNRLLELRELHGMTRVQVAAELGIGEAQVRRWEKQQAAIPTRHLRPLCELFECSPEHLLGWDREPQEVA